MAAEKKGKMNVYNAKGSPEEHEADDESPEFKKGGRAKRKDGGKAEGHMAKMRADKKPRHHRAMGGKTPYSSGHAVSDKESSGASGHESERPGD